LIRSSVLAPVGEAEAALAQGDESFGYFAYAKEQYDRFDTSPELP